MLTEIALAAAYWGRILRDAMISTARFFSWKMAWAVATPLLLVVGMVLQFRLRGAEAVVEHLKDTVAYGVVPVVGLALLVFIFNFVVAPPRLLRDDRREAEKERGRLLAERDGLASRLDAIERTKPRLRLARAFTDVRQLGSSLGPIGIVSFAHAIIKNDPDVPAPTSAAVVLAEISYFDPSGKLLLEVVGRWGDSDQPVDRGATRSTIDLQRVEIGIGMSRELNLAMKYPAEDDCYGFSNETYRVPDWRLPPYRIVGRRFRVSVRLRGALVDQRFDFWITHTGRGSELALDPFEAGS